MTISWQAVAALAAPIVVWVLNRYLEKRPRLVSLIGPVSLFTLPSSTPPGVSANLVFGYSVVVKNSGKKAATNVRIVHKVLPDFRINPYVRHTVERQASGEAEIVFPTLVPEEQVTISYLFFDSTRSDMVYIHTKSDEGFAQTLEAIPTPKRPMFVWLLRGFALVGIAATVYFLLSWVVPYASR
jgi:hypothetical protein